MRKKDRMQTGYISRMKQVWAARNLTPSDALIECWKQLEIAVRELRHGLPYWQVMQWPTGTGKTTALTVLLSLLENSIHHPGVLIVTKYRTEANELQSSVNQLSGWNQARAFHTGTDNPTGDLALAPVLIITHAFYERALKELSRGNSARYDQITNFHHGKRSWIIIDEAFDWVDTYKLSNADLRSMCADLSAIVSGQVRDDLKSFLAVLLDLADTGRVKPNHRLTADQFEKLSRLDFVQLRSAVAALPDQIFAHWEETRGLSASGDGYVTDQPKQASLRRCYLNHLDELQSIKEAGFAWSGSRERRTQLHSSRSLLPAERMRGIILDATAGIDVRYELMTEQVRVLPRPENVRTYSAVRVHVSKGHRVGKEHLQKTGNEHWPAISAQLTKRLIGRQTLICTHKSVSSFVRNFEAAHQGRAFTHWGDIDGKNEWSDKSAAVFFGLPYTDNSFAIDTFFAHVGPQGDDWLRTARRYGAYDDICKALVHSFIMRSVVQAINRIRCRRLIDASGNCDPTDVYLLLPSGSTNEAVVNAIVQQMPGVHICKWNAEVAKRKVRAASCKSRLLAFFDAAKARTYSKSEVILEIRTNARTFERVITQLLEPASELARELTSRGVQYWVQTGRGREAYFIKQ